MLTLSMNKKRELRIFLRILAKTVWAAGLMVILVSCGTSPGYNYTISGTISGMAGSGMVLQDNGGDDRTISANGAFSFQTALADGTAYSVTVKTQPTAPSQTCVISNSSGTINGSPVMNVAVSCTMSSSPVTVDPFGLFAYVSSSGSSNISGYTINTDGSLTSMGSSFPTGTYPSQVTVDPSGNFAYVANRGDGTVSANTVNQTTGALTAIGSPLPAGTSPLSVTIYPYTSGSFASSGEFAYVPNMGSGTISAYEISSADGSLTAVTGSPFTAGTSPTSVTIYADGSSTYTQGPFAYVPNMTDNTISVYTIGTTGALTASLTSPTVSTGIYPVSITVYADPGNIFASAYVANMGGSNISVYTIGTDGSLSNSATSPAVTTGTYPMSVTIYTNSSGASFAYVSNIGSSNISVFTISSTDGSLSPNPGTLVAASTYPNPVTIYTNSSGAFAYVSNMGDGTIWVYAIGASGALTNIQKMIPIGAPTGISLTTVTIDPKGPYAYVSDSSTGNVYAFTIGADGKLTQN